MANYSIVTFLNLAFMIIPMDRCHLILPPPPSPNSSITNKTYRHSLVSFVAEHPTLHITYLDLVCFLLFFKKHLGVRVLPNACPTSADGVRVMPTDHNAHIHPRVAHVCYVSSPYILHKIYMLSWFHLSIAGYLFSLSVNTEGCISP